MTCADGGSLPEETCGNTSEMFTREKEKDKMKLPSVRSVGRCLPGSHLSGNTSSLSMREATERKRKSVVQSVGSFIMSTYCEVIWRPYMSLGLIVNIVGKRLQKKT